MTGQADVVVVGLGPGGEEVAGKLAEAGLEVVGIERRLVGGECPYWGCIPSKMMIRAANVLAEARRVDSLAGQLSVTPDWAPVASESAKRRPTTGTTQVAVDRLRRRAARSCAAGRLTGPRHGHVDGRRTRRGAASCWTSERRRRSRRSTDSRNALLDEPGSNRGRETCRSHSSCSAAARSAWRWRRRSRGSARTVTIVEAADGCCHGGAGVAELRRRRARRGRASRSTPGCHGSSGSSTTATVHGSRRADGDWVCRPSGCWSRTGREPEPRRPRARHGRPRPNARAIAGRRAHPGRRRACGRSAT